MGDLVVVDPTGVVLCAVCRCVLEDGAVRQQGPDGDEFVCPEHASFELAEQNLSTVDPSEIHYRPSINARLPFVWDCKSCWVASGFGRYRSFAEALDAKAAHACPKDAVA